VKSSLSPYWRQTRVWTVLNNEVRVGLQELFISEFTVSVLKGLCRDNHRIVMGRSVVQMGV